MRDKLSTHFKKVLAAALLPHSYNPFANNFILSGALLALPVPLAVIFFHSPPASLGTSPTRPDLATVFNQHPEYWLLLLQPFIFGWMFGIAGTLYKKELCTLKDQLKKLHSKAILDPLTGISNRRYFIELFSDELARSRRKRVLPNEAYLM